MDLDTAWEEENYESRAWIKWRGLKRRLEVVPAYPEEAEIVVHAVMTIGNNSREVSGQSVESQIFGGQDGCMKAVKSTVTAILKLKAHDDLPEQ